MIERLWGHIPGDELRKMTHKNAAHLYRWPLPPEADPKDWPTG